MSERNDGDAAFPVPNDANVNGQKGMSMRDYFAATIDIPWDHVKAVLVDQGNRSPTIQDVINARAMFRYREADAMLKERDK